MNFLKLFYFNRLYFIRAYQQLNLVSIDVFQKVQQIILLSIYIVLNQQLRKIGKMFGKMILRYIKIFLIIFFFTIYFKYFLLLFYRQIYYEVWLLLWQQLLLQQLFFLLLLQKENVITDFLVNIMNICIYKTKNKTKYHVLMIN